MKSRSTQRGQTLILIAAWLFFGGGAASALMVYDRPVSDVKKSVKRVITDTGRRDELLADISHWAAGQKKLDKQVSADRDDLLKLLRRKDAQRSDAQPLMVDLDNNLANMDRDFLDLRFHLKVQVTSAEWSAMVTRPAS